MKFNVCGALFFGHFPRLKPNMVIMAEGGFEPQKSPSKTLEGASRVIRLLTFIVSLI